MNLADIFSLPWVMELSIFVCVSAFVLLLVHVLRREDALITSRLHDQFPNLAETGRFTRTPADLLRQISTLSSFGAHVVPSDEQTRLRLRKRLMLAGIHSSEALWLFFAARLVLMICPLLLSLSLILGGALSPTRGILLAAMASGVGMLLPTFWLDRLIHRRQNQLRRSLPDFLDLFVVCVEGGLTLQAALPRVADELKSAHPAMAREFTMTAGQLEFGHSIQDAFRELAERTGLEECRTMSIFVQQSARYGAMLGSALREMAESLRIQREQRAEELAQKANVKILLPTLLCIFPAVFVVLAGPAAIRVMESVGAKNSPVAKASK
jgi:tight adherence protein C